MIAYKYENKNYSQNNLITLLSKYILNKQPISTIDIICNEHSYYIDVNEKAGEYTFELINTDTEDTIGDQYSIDLYSVSEFYGEDEYKTTLISKGVKRIFLNFGKYIEKDIDKLKNGKHLLG